MQYVRAMRWLPLVLLVTACGVESRSPPNNFVGELSGSRALISVLRDPTLTSIYVCDGTVSPATFEWFTADTADQLTATSDSGASTIDLDFTTGTGAFGSGTFTLIAVDPGFGLYRGTEDEDDGDFYEVGIIVLNEDTQNGVVGVTSPGSQEVTPLVTPRIEVNQTRVTLLNGVAIPIQNVLNAYLR